MTAWPGVVRPFTLVMPKASVELRYELDARCTITITTDDFTVTLTGLIGDTLVTPSVVAAP